MINPNDLEHRSIIPGLLDCNVAAEFLQTILSCVMVNDENTFFHIRPFGTLKYSNRCRGSLQRLMGKKIKLNHPCYGRYKVTELTSKFGSVTVTCSPLPTSRSPSHVVSMEAGLKSSMTKKKTFIFYNNHVCHC